MKCFMLIALCSVVACASAFTTQPYGNDTLTVGHRLTKNCFADELVLKKEVRVHNKFNAGSLLGKTFETTETFTPGKGMAITMIIATDLKKNGATAKIIRGGIGSPSVTIKFENKKHGIHYDVKIYAAKF